MGSLSLVVRLVPIILCRGQTSVIDAEISLESVSMWRVDVPATSRYRKSTIVRSFLARMERANAMLMKGCIPHPY